MPPVVDYSLLAKKKIIVRCDKIYNTNYYGK